MKRRIVREEKGQTVVIVALSIVVLLAFLGLAVDGSAVYLSRRRMQNAADAGALAGTLMLAEAICGHVEVDDAAIAAEVVEYAERNGVEDADGLAAFYVHFEDGEVVPYDPQVLVGGGTIPIGATGVMVSTTITQSNYFLGLVGQPTGVASASATAVTSPPLVGGGLRPFGLPQDLVTGLSVGDSFTIDFDNNQFTYEGDPLDQHRGWMNLGYVWNQGEDPDYPRANKASVGAGGSGNDDSLGGWMVDGWDGILYADCEWAAPANCRYGDYVHAAPGKKSSVVKQAPVNELSYVPVYDVIVECTSTSPPPPKADCPMQGGSYVYHIVGFTAVTVTTQSQGAGTITMELAEVMIGEEQVCPLPEAGYGEQNACEFNLQVISLWH